MEIRVLRYFLEIAREETMTRMAQRLHISQSSLSKQMKELETELGKKLFVRSNYSIHLTKEGMLPRKRAEDPLAQAVGRLNRHYPGIHDHIFCSEQSTKSDLPRRRGEKADHLNIMATFNLSNNGAVFVKEGLGICLTFNRLIETTPNSGICFRPVTPILHTKVYVIWKKYQVFTAVSKLLLEKK
ncbi:MAG: LysR family transcriptional regulator [Hungatella sp.]|nr:LysR family transcriptional regulator [Hungatella sp.]